jgi:hypothetical protein
MRRRARVDDNQRAIVDWLRGVGAFVQSLAGLGQGVPDLLVGFRGVWYVFEIKDGAKRPSARRLTNDEIGWHTIARLHAPTHTVTSIDDVAAVLTLTAAHPSAGATDRPPG